MSPKTIVKTPTQIYAALNRGIFTPVIYTGMTIGPDYIDAAVGMAAEVLRARNGNVPLDVDLMFLESPDHTFVETALYNAPNAPTA